MQPIFNFAIFIPFDAILGSYAMLRCANGKSL